MKNSIKLPLLALLAISVTACSSYSTMSSSEALELQSAEHYSIKTSEYCLDTYSEKAVEIDKTSEALTKLLDDYYVCLDQVK